MTPEEAWNGRILSVKHFKIFGCIAYAHIPNQKRKKLDEKGEKGEKCIFLGISEQSKAYKLYNPITKKNVISCNVIFDEERFWIWDENNAKQQIQADFDEENEDGRQQPLEKAQPVQNEQQTQAKAKDERPKRVRRQPTRMEDYEVQGIEHNEDPLTHFALFPDCNPVAFKEAVKKSKWRKAMDVEIAAIERNNT